MPNDDVKNQSFTFDTFEALVDGKMSPEVINSIVATSDGILPYIGPKEEYEGYRNRFDEDYQFDDAYKAAKDMTDAINEGYRVRYGGPILSMAEVYDPYLPTFYKKEYPPALTTSGLTGAQELYTPAGLALSQGVYRKYNPKTKQDEIHKLTWEDQHMPWNMLVMDYEKDKNGNKVYEKPYIRKLNSWANIDQYELINAWRIRPMTGMAFKDVAFGFLSGLITETLQSMQTMTTISTSAQTELAKWILGVDSVTSDTGELFPSMEEAGGPERVMEEYLDVIPKLSQAVANMYEKLKWEPSYEVERNGWFGSLPSFLYYLTNGSSYLLPQRGAAIGIMRLGESINAAKTLSTLIGTAQAINGQWEAGRANGLSDKDNVINTMLSIPAVGITEWALVSPIMLRGLGFNGKQMFRQSASSQLGVPLRGTRMLSERQMLDVNKNTWLDFLSKSRESLAKIPRWDLRGYLQSSVREGLQEPLEEAWYMGVETWYDHLRADETYTPGLGKYGTEWFTPEAWKRLGENALAGAALGGAFNVLVDVTSKKTDPAIMNDYNLNQVATDGGKRIREVARRYYNKGKTGLVRISPTEFARGGVMWGRTDIDQFGNALPRGGKESLNKEQLSQYPTSQFDFPDMSIGTPIVSESDKRYYDWNVNMQYMSDFVNASGINRPDLIKMYAEMPQPMIEMRDIYKKITKANMELETAKKEGDTGKVKAKEDEIVALKQRHDDLTKPISETNPRTRVYEDELLKSTIRARLDRFANFQQKNNVTDQDIAVIRTRMKELRALREKRKTEIAEYPEMYSNLLLDIEKISDITPEYTIKQVREVMSQLDAITKQLIPARATLTTIAPESRAKVEKIKTGLENLFKSQIIADEDVDPSVKTALSSPVQIATPKQLLEGSPNILRKYKPIIDSIDNLDKKLKVKGDYINLNPKYTVEEDTRVVAEAIAKPLIDEYKRIEGVVNVASQQTMGEDLNKLMEEVERQQKFIRSAIAYSDLNDMLGKNMAEIEDNFVDEEGIITPGSLPYNKVDEEEAPGGVRKITPLGNIAIVLDNLHALTDEFLKTKDQIILERERTESDNKRRHIASSLQFHMQALGFIQATDPKKYNSLSTRMTAFMDEIKDILDFEKISDDDLIAFENKLDDFRTEMRKLSKNIPEDLDRIIESFFAGVKEIVPAAEYAFPVDSKNINDNDCTRAFTTLDNGKIVNASVGNAFEAYARYMNLDDKAKNNSILERAVLSNFILRWVNEINTTYLYPIKNTRAAYNEYVSEAKLDYHKDNILSIQQEKTLLLAIAIDKSEYNFNTRRFRADELGEEEDKTAKAFSRYKEFKNRGLNVQGLAGVGKTLEIVPAIIGTENKILQRENDKPKNIHIVAADSEQIDTILGTISDSWTYIKKSKGQTHDQFISAMKNKKINPNDYDIIILDEASRLRASDIKLLMSTFKDSNTFFLFTIDPQQSTDSGEKYELYELPVFRMLPRSQLLSEIYRSGNYYLTTYQMIISKSMQTFNATEVKEINTKYNSRMDKGMRYVNDVVEQWIEDILSPQLSNNRYLIFSTYEERQKAVEGILKKRDGITQEHLKRVLFVNYGPTNPANTKGVYSVHGKQFNIVYDATDMGVTIGERRIKKTAMSRAKQMLVVKGTPEKSTMDENIPEIVISNTELEKKFNFLKKRAAALAGEWIESGKSSTKKGKPSKANASDEEDGKGIVEKERPSFTLNNVKEIDSLLNTSWNDVNNPDIVRILTNVYPDNDVVLIREGRKIKTTSKWVYELTELVSYKDKGRKKFKEVKYYYTPAEMKARWRRMQEQVPEEPATNPESDQEQDEIDKYDSVEYYTLVKSAKQFKNNSLPISLASNDPSEPGMPQINEQNFTEPFFNTKFSRIKQGGLRLVYYKEKVLVSSDNVTGINLTSPSFKNVICLEDDTGKHIGVLYQPQFIKNGKIVKIDSKKGDYNYVSNFEQSGFPDGALVDNYMNYLFELYQRGQSLTNKNKTDKEIVEEVSYKSHTNGTIHIDARTPRLFGGKMGLFAEMTEKGYWFIDKNGNRTKNISDIKVEIRENKKTGKIENVAFATLDPKAVKYREIHLKGAMISPKEDPMGDPTGVKALMRKEIEQFKVMASEIDNGRPRTIETSDGKKQAMTPSMFFEMFNKSNLYQTIQHNRYMFKRGDEVYNRKDVFEISDKRLNIKGDAKIYNMMLNVESVIPELEKGFMNIKKENLGTVRIFNENNETYDKIYTIVKKAESPIAYVWKGSRTAKKEEKTTKGRTEFPVEEGGAAMDMTEGLPTYPSQLEEEKKKKLIRIFGESFIANALEFSPHPTLYGKEVWGLVHDFKMILKSVDGEVPMNVEDHEIVHYAMNYFIDNPSYQKIMRAVRRQMRADRVQTGDIDDNAVREYIAELYRNKREIRSELKGVTGLIKRFINWFTELVNNVTYFTDDIYVFFNNLDKGYFVNHSIVGTNFTEPAAMDMVEEENEDTPKEESPVETLTEGERIRLTQIFPNEKQQMFASTRITSQIIESSVFNRDIFDNVTFNFDQALRNNREENIKILIDELTQEVFNEYDSYFSYKQARQNIKDFNPSDFFVVKMYNEPIYNLLIKKQLKRINLTKEEAVTFLTNMFESQDSTDFKTTMSVLLQLQLSVIKANTYKIVDGTTDLVERVDSTKNFVDTNQLIGLLRDIAHRTPFSSQNRDRLKIFLDNTYKDAIRFMSNNSTTDKGNILMSFLEVIDDSYFGRNVKDTIQNKGTLSHMAIHEYASDVISYRDLDPSSDEYANLMAKIKGSHDVLATLSVFFNSLHKNSNSTVDYATKKGEFYFVRKMRYTDSLTEQKNIIKNNMVFKNYTSGYINKSLKEKIDGGKKASYRINISEGTIEKKNKGAFEPILYYNPTLERFEFDHEEEKPVIFGREIASNDLNTLLSFFGIYLSPNTLNTILGYYDVPAMSEYEVADMLGHMFLTAGHYFDVEGADKMTTMLDGYMQKHKIPLERIAELEGNDIKRYDMNALSDADKKIVKEMHLINNKYTFLAFFDAIAKMAEIETDINANITSDFVRKPGGSKAFIFTLANHISKDLVNMDREDGYASDAATLSWEEAISSMPENSVHPFINPDGTYNEKLVDKNSGFSIRKIEQVLGIGELASVNTNKATEKDVYNMVLTNFFEGFMKKRNQEFLFVPLDSMADFNNIIIAEMTLGRKNNDRKIFNVVYDENGIPTGISLNEVVVNEEINSKFDNHYRNHQISLMRWNTLVPFSTQQASIFSKANERIDKQLIAKINAYLGKINNITDEKQFRAKLDILSRAGLIGGLDYIVDKNKVYIGKDAMMDLHEDVTKHTFDHPYTLDNYYYWKSYYNDPDVSISDKATIRRQLFWRRYLALEKTMQNIDYWLPDDVYNLLPQTFKRAHSEYYKVPVTERVEGKYVARKLGRYDVWEFNPIFEGFLMASHIANESVSNLRHNNAQVSNSINYYKYNKANVAGGYQMYVDKVHEVPYYTLGKEYNVMVLLDNEESVDTLKDNFAVPGDLVRTDGSALFGPMFLEFLYNSMGGSMSMISTGDNTIKDIYTGTNRRSGIGTMMKGANFKFNEDMMDSEYGGYLMRFFLTYGNPDSPINLYNIYLTYRNEMSPTQALKALSNFIIEYRIKNNVDLLENTVAKIIHKSTLKEEDGGVNYITLDEFKEAIKDEKIYKERSKLLQDGDRLNNTSFIIKRYNSEDTYVQLNANQDFEEQTVRRQSQLLAIVGTTDRNYVRTHAISKVEAEITSRGINSLLDRLERAPKEVFDKIFRNIGLSGTGHMSESTNLHYLLSNDNISMQFPPLSGSVIPMFINKYNDAIRWKQNGLLMVQAPDDFMEVYEGTDDYGNPIMMRYSEVIKDPKGQKKRSLDYYRFYDANNNEIVGDKALAAMVDRKNELKKLIRRTKPEKRTPLIEEIQRIDKEINAKRKQQLSKVHYIKAAEVIMPFIQKEKFGVREGDTPTLNEVMTLVIGSKRLNVKAFVQKNSANYYLNRTDGLEKLREEIKDVASLEEGSWTMRADYEFNSIDDVINYYSALLESLIVMGTRIPTSAWGSSFVGDVVAFTWDSGSTIYVSPRKNVLDNSDFDIDQLVVTYRNMTYRNGRVFYEVLDNINEELRIYGDTQLKNYIFDQIVSAYLDPRNLDLMLTPIDVQMFKDYVEDHPNNIMYHDVSSSIKQYIGSQDGKNLVAFFARQLQVAARLYHLNPTVRDKIISFDVPSDNRILGITQKVPVRQYGYEDLIDRTEFILSTIADFLQVSVDNPKLSLTNLLYINLSSANLIGSLALSGYSKNEILALLSDPYVKSIIRRMESQRSVGEQKVKFEDIIAEMRLGILNMKDEDFLTDYKKNELDFINKRIKEIQEKSSAAAKELKRAAKKIRYKKEYPDQVKGYTFMEAGVLHEIAYGTDEYWNMMADLTAEEVIESYKKDKDTIDERIQKLKNSADQNLARLDLVEKMYYRGEWMRRLGDFFSLAQGMDVKHYDIYNQADNFEFYLGQPLNYYPEDVNDYRFWDNDEYIEGVNYHRGRFMEGYKQEPNPFFKTSQDKVDQHVKAVFEDVLQRIAATHPDIRLNFYSSGQSGFSESVKLFSDQSEVNIIMPEQYKYREASGIDMIDGNIRFSKYPVKISTSDQDYKGNNKAIKTAIGDNGVTVIFEAYPSIETNAVKKDFGGKRQVVVKPDPNTISSEAERIYNLINVAYQNEITGMAKSGLTKEEINESLVKVKVNISGNALSSMHLVVPTEYEKWHIAEEKIRANGNIAQIIRRIPNMDAYLNGFIRINNLLKRFYNYSDFAKSLERDFLEKQKYNRFPNSEIFYEFHKILNASIINQYFLNNVTEAIRLPQTDYDSPSLKSMNISLPSWEDQRYFKHEFEQYILNKLEIQDPLFVENKFLSNLTFTPSGIMLRGVMSMSKTNKAMFAKEFSNLPMDLQMLFWHYNLLSSGFTNRRTSFNDIIGQDYLENISQYIERWNTAMLEDNPLKTEYMDNFVINAVMRSKTLPRKVSRKKLKTSTKRENLGTIISMQEFIPLASDPDQIRSVVPRHMIYDKNTDDFSKVYDKFGSDIQSMPVDTSAVSKVDVLHPMDIDSYRSFVNNTLQNNEPTEFVFPGTHNYVNGQDAMVLTTPVKIHTSSVNPNTTINVTLPNKADAFTPTLKRKHLDIIAIRQLAEIYNKSLVGIDIEVIPQDESLMPEKMGYVVGNTVYLSNNITSDTLMHELSHPLLYMLKYSSTKEHNDLYDRLMKEAKMDLDNGSEIARIVQQKNPTLHGETLLREITATKIGLTSSKKVEVLVGLRSEAYMNIVEWAKNVWRQLNNFLLTKLGFRRIPTTLQEITDETPIRYIYDIIANELINGNVSKYLNFSEKEFFKNYQNWMNNVDTHYESVKMVENIKDLDDILLSLSPKTSLQSVMDNNFVNSVADDVIKSVDKVYRFYGEEFDFADIYRLDPTIQDKKIRERVREQILPFEKKRRQKQSDNLFNFLSNDTGGGHGFLSSKNIDTFFNNPKKYNYDSLLRMKSIMKHSETDIVIRYNDLQAFFKKEGFDADIYDPAFSELNPIVLIHSISRAGREITGINMSIFHDSIDNTGITEFRRGSKLITSLVLDDAVAKASNVTQENNLAESRKVQLAMLIMKIRDGADKNRINIVNAGIFDISPTRPLLFIGLNIYETLNTLNAFQASPKLMDKLPKSIRDLITKRNLYDGTTYNTDYIRMLQGMWSEYIEEHTDTNKSERYSEKLNVINDYANGVGGPKETMDMLEQHRQELMKRRAVNPNSKITINKEIEIISAILYGYHQYRKDPLSREQIKKISRPAGFLTNIQDIGHRILQDVFQHIYKNQLVITGIHQKFLDEMNPLFEDIVKIYEQREPSARVSKYFINRDERIFERIYKLEKIKDINGNLEDRMVGKIHWDENDPETRAALDRWNNPATKWNKDALSPEELRFGKFVADNVERFIKEHLRHILKDELDAYDKTKANWVLNEKLLEEKVNRVYRQNWTKGMVPVMNKRIGEYLGKGKYIKALQKFYMQTGRPDIAYEDIMDLNEGHYAEDRVISIFQGQFYKNVQKAGYGAKDRMDILGLKMDVDDVYVFDPKQNENVSGNLYTIMQYFSMDITAKRITDTYIMPRILDAKFYMNIVQATMNVDQEFHKKLLDIYEQSIVHGRQLYMFDDEFLNKKVTPAVRLLLRITQFSGVALSVPVATTSMTANMVEALITSIANKFVNPYDMFTPGEWLQANKEFVAHKQKLEALALMYQVTEAGKFDYLRNPRRDPLLKKRFTTARGMHYLSWWTDNNARLVTMAAQMIHDGTYDAHEYKDGKIIYDPKKDKRFYTNGKLTEDRNKLGIRNFIRRDLIESEVTRKDQEGKEDLVRAYSIDDAMKLKWIADEWVIGTYDKENTALGDNYVAFDVFFQFRKFLLSKYQTRLGMKKETIRAGKREVIIDENGNEIYNWLPFIREGSWTTTGRLAYEYMALAFNGKSLKEHAKLTDVERYNMIRAGLDMFWIGAAFFIFGSLKDLPDDRKSLLAQNRIVRAIRNGFITPLTFTPWEALRLVSEIPIFGELQRLFKVITLDATQNDFMRLLPGYSTIESIEDLMRKDRQFGGYGGGSYGGGGAGSKF